VPIKNWFAVIVGVICITLGLSSPTAFGQAFHTTSAMNTGQDWFNTNPVYSNTVWVRTDKGGVERYASGIMLDPYNMLVSGHQLFSSGQGHTNTVVMGTGSSHLTDPGLMISASNWMYHPGWNGSVFSQTVDLGIAHFPEGVPGISTLTIGSSILGEQLFAGGFGQAAAGGQWQDLDGFGRGYKMWVDGFGNGGTISSNYIKSDFLPMFLRNDPMAGGGSPGSSGSGVFNLSGDLVGLLVGGSAGGGPAPPFGTYSLRLDLYEGWITQNMYVVPAPGALALLGMAGLFGALRRRAA